MAWRELYSRRRCKKPVNPSSKGQHAHPLEATTSARIKRGVPIGVHAAFEHASISFNESGDGTLSLKGQGSWADRGHFRSSSYCSAPSIGRSHRSRRLIQSS
jgi:hypothetical protein